MDTQSGADLRVGQVRVRLNSEFGLLPLDCWIQEKVAFHINFYYESQNRMSSDSFLDFRSNMANARGATVDGDMMRYAEYSPKTSMRSDAEIDRQLGRTLIAVGLGVAAAGLAGRYAFHLWKPLGQVFSDTVKKMPASAFSSYYKGGFEQKMSKREASLILGISPASTKAKVREAHLRIMVLNHPDKGGSPYLAAKINEAKDLLDKETRR